MAAAPKPQLIPSAMTPPLNARLVTDEAGLELVRNFLDRTRVFGLDVETNVTETFIDRRLRTIQVGNRDEQYVIDLLPFCERAGVTLVDAQGPNLLILPWRGNPHPCLAPIVNLLAPYLESKDWLKVGQNLIFEYIMLKWCLGLRPWNFYDCEVVEREIHKGKYRYYASGVWGMEALTESYLGVTLVDEGLQKSFDLMTPLTPAQVDYAALDTRLPLGIKAGQEYHIRKYDLALACKIENDAIPAFGDMKINGVKLRIEDDPEVPDAPSWMRNLEETMIEHRRRIGVLDTFAIPVVGTKHIPEVDLVALEKKWKDHPNKTAEEKAARAALRQEFYAARRKQKEIVEAWGTYEGDAAINYNSNPQLLKLLHALGYKQLKYANEDTLARYEGEPVIDALSDYRETKQVLKTYSPAKFLSHINAITGRIHAEIHQQGADTGRATCSKPNIFNINRGKDWRSCFITDPGWLVLTADYSGQELRIMAEMSGEQLWIDAFLKGWDVHSLSAEMLFEHEWREAAAPGCAYYEKNDKGEDHQKCKCEKHKFLREQVKAVNFGIAYGMSWRRLVNELRKLGIIITREQAEALLAKWKKTFSTLWKWLSKQAKNALYTWESRTMSNRRRQYTKPSFALAKAKWIEDNFKELQRDPTDNEVIEKQKAMSAHIERQGMNTPVQGTGADMAKLAMGCGFDENGKPFAWHILEPKYGARQVNFIYDEIVAESRKEVAKPCYADLTDAMTRGAQMFIKSIPFPTEGNIAICWKK